MRKIIYILSVLSLIFLSACEVESGDHNSYKTIQGKQAFDQVRSYNDDIFYLTEMLSRASLYMAAPASQKEAIRDYYLSSYTIEEDIDKKTVTLKDKTSSWIFTHNGKAINQTEAIWNITLTVKAINGDDITIITSNNYTLESKGDKTWKLTIAKLPAYITGLINYKFGFDNYTWARSQGYAQYATLEVSAKETIDKADNLYNYIVTSGSGYTESELQIRYTIQRPIVYASSIKHAMKMTECVVDIEVTGTNIKEQIKAMLDDENITITMHDITEVYRDYSYFW